MKKYLFFDVDGTLYDSEKKLPDSAKEALFAARANGHELVIATGRAPFMIQSLLDELKIDTYITFNGQYVVHKGKVIFTDGIAIEQLAHIIAFGEQRNHPVVFLDDQKMIASKSGEVCIEQSLATLRYPYPEIDTNYYKEHAIYQTLLFIEAQEQPLYEITFPDIHFVRWHKQSCDLLPKGGSKARGIEKLCAHLNVDMKDAIAFGDGLNDVEMLTAVGTGVAMGNGHSAALQAADIIAEHVDQGGLYKIMKKLELI